MNQCKLKLLDAFAGIGGFSYAAERLVGGFETKQFIEIDPYCQSVLKKNFPNIPIHNDITTFQSYQGEYDLLTAGFPCQDLSVAGSQKGIGAGTRSGLFYEVMRLVRLIRPRFVLLENVRNLISHQQGETFQEILFQIAQAGYDAEWSIVSARDLGACHKRERIWIIAYPKHDGLPPSEEQRIHDETSDRDKTRQDTTLQPQGSSESGSDSDVRGTTQSTTANPTSTGTGEHQPRLRRQPEGGSLQGAGDTNQEVSDPTNSNSTRPQGLGTQPELREGSSEKKASWFGGRLDEQPANPMCSGLEGQIRPRFPGPIRWKGTPTSGRLNPFWREYLSKPTLRRGDDGLSNRVPRLKALGNTIVPACAAVPLQRIKHLSTYPHYEQRSIPRAS